MPRTIDSNHVLIGVNSWFEDFEVTTIGTADDGYPFSNAANGKTFDFWRPGGAGAGFQIPVDPIDQPEYMGIAAHSLGSENAELELIYTAAGADRRVKHFNPNNDKTIGWLTGQTLGAGEVDPINAASWSIRQTGASLTGLVGVILLGKLLEVPSMIYEGHQPLRWAKNQDIRPRLSASGQHLGTTLYRYGKQTQVNIRNIPPMWFRDNEDSILSLAHRPFFLWWRPDRYPEEVEYCWCNRDPEVRNTGPAGLMSLRLDVSAYDG